MKKKTIDLSKLTKAEKLKMLDLLEEKARRLIERREHFTPNEGQAPVLEAFSNDDIETVLVLTGNGGGKTALGVNIALESANGYIRHSKKNLPVPARIIVVLDKPEKVDSVWMPEIKKWYSLKPDQCHKRGKPYISQLSFDNGSELTFMFHDQEPMSFESVEADVFIFDEPPPKHIFIALRRAGRKKGRKPKYLIIGTPLAAPWLRKELYEPWARGERPELACFRFSTHVNKENLSDGYIDQFGKYLSEKEKQIRLHGEFFDLEGLALAHLFDRKTHTLPAPRWPESWPVIIAIDPHPKKAHTAVMVGITKDGGLIALKELASRSVPSRFAEELKAWYAGYRVVDIVCDSLGSGDMTGGDGRLSFIQVLKSYGVRLRPTTFDEKRDEAWIQAIQEVLAIPLEADQFGKMEPRLKVSNHLKGLIADIETVEWQKYKNLDEFKPKLAIDSKDFLSCLKYILAADPHFNKSRERRIRPKGPVGWSQRAALKIN